MSGQIPASLGDLTGLETLDLSSNKLTGNIPVELGSLTNLEELRLNGNQLTGEIPDELGTLPNLEVLRISGNQLSGCITQELGAVPQNDFSSSGLPNCGLLLSGLTIDRAALTPAFDPKRASYTAVAEVSRITVTPASDHGATFQFLDAHDAEIADFDGNRAGHQVPLVIGDTTVKVRVVSQDQSAQHVYTIVVTLPDAVSRYDSDGDGAIARTEVLDAITDYLDNLISRDEVITVISAYLSL